MKIQNLFSRALQLVFKGILVVLPLVILIWILSFFYSIFEKIVTTLFNITANSISATIIIIILIFTCLFYIGFLFEKSKEFILLKFGDFIIKKIPLIGAIYGVLKDIIKMLSGSGGKEYLGVGFVCLGSAELIAFITKEDGDFFWVFVPTTPNPTSGILMRIPKSALKKADMSVAEGFKRVVSLGLK